MTNPKSTQPTFRGSQWLILVLVAGIAPSLCAQDFPSSDSSGQLIWDGTNWVSPAPPAAGTPEAAIANIRQMVDRSLNKSAGKAVDAFLLEYPDSPQAEEAMNLAGQADLNRGEYWAAFEWYRRQIETYPNGAFYLRAMDRMYTIADAFLKGRKRRVFKFFKMSAQDEGIEILTLIGGWAPATGISEKATLRLGDYYFAEELYKNAIGVYDQFVEESPHSDRRPYAMLQAARASLLSFHGVDWEIAPLREAEERFRVFRQAYPRQAKGENIDEILAEIHLTKAHKLYQTGRFYDRVKRPRAAVFYYRKVVDEYPRTHWAESARVQLEIMGPVTPEEPLDFPTGPAEEKEQVSDPSLASEATEPQEVSPTEPEETEYKTSLENLSEEWLP